MLKRFYLLILIVLLVGCSSSRQSVTVPMIQQDSVNNMGAYRQVPAFTQVNATGHINLHLHTGYAKPQLILKGDPRDLAETITGVDGTTLYITVKKGFPKYGHIIADIRGQFLNTLTYQGSGLIYGPKLHTSYLELDLENQGTTVIGGTIGLQKLHVAGNGITRISGIKSHDLRIRLRDNPKVQLSGSVSLSRLNVEGDGWLSMFWLKSPSLIIKARNNSKIQLAGMVNRLEIELWGSATFKGRYLRANRSFVKTHDTSTAEISSVNHQSTLASDSSDIYYYNLSVTRADFMADSGSVLDMRSWGQYDLKDFTRYNKQFP